MIDQTTAEGKALQAVVKGELRGYLGKDYNDDVLPLYIVVMLAHGNQQPLVAENLEAFLGQEKAIAFSSWLFQHLDAHPGKYETPAPAAEEVKQSTVAVEAASPPENEEAKKRKRDKREKIEWKSEAAPKSRHRDRDREREERRDEKRRRSGEREERDRERGRERGSRRDHEDHRSRQDSAVNERDRPERERRSDRHERQRAREQDREADAYGHRPEAWDDDRRESRRGRDRHREEPREEERPARISSRLAGRLGEAVAKDLPPQLPGPPKERQEARPSIFDRLGKLSAGREAKPLGKPAESRSKMRMDSMPEVSPERIEDSPTQEPPPPAKPPASSPGLGAPDEVAAELRQIRETLAQMQAEKKRQVTAGLASANARRAVVHNVHFNSTPDILKAHFSGCGAVVSAIIEKDPAGNPKGVAVVEFEEESSRRAALTLSGSALLGRPITVFPKESAPTSPLFKPRAPTFGTRAPMPGRSAGRLPGRGPGRGSFAGRTKLKNNKYVRPQSAANGSSAAGGQPVDH